jgi:hypothetical protein
LRRSGSRSIKSGRRMIVGLRCTRGHAGRRETFCAAFASGQKAYVISRFETLVWRPLWNVTQLWPNTILFGRMSDDDTAKSEFSMSPWQVWPAPAEWHASVPTVAGVAQWLPGVRHDHDSSISPPTD